MAGTGKQQHRHRPSTFRADAPLITCNPHTARARRLGKRGTHLAGLLRQVDRNGPNLLPPATGSTTRPVTPMGRAGRTGGSKFRRILEELPWALSKTLTSFSILRQRVRGLAIGSSWQRSERAQRRARQRHPRPSYQDIADHGPFSQNAWRPHLVWVSQPLGEVQKWRSPIPRRRLRIREGAAAPSRTGHPGRFRRGPLTPTAGSRATHPGRPVCPPRSRGR